MIYKKKVKRIEEHDEVGRVICDFCGETICSTDPFLSHDVELSARTGYNYPEGDFRTVTKFECCPTCWTDKLLPTIKAMAKTGPAEYEASDTLEDFYKKALYDPEPPVSRS
jgi:hypothetical protein